MQKHMPFSKSVSILLNIIAWLLFFGLILSFTLDQRRNLFSELILSLPFLLFSFFYIGVHYLNQFYLFPQLYLKKKYFLFFISILVLLLFTIYLQPFDGLMSAGRMDGVAPQVPPEFPGRGPRHRPGFDIISFILFMVVILSGSLNQLIKRWQKIEQRAVQAEADKANAELALLKAQVNPHFLFNTLNNIYSLSVSQNQQVPDAILKLSNIMRFFTDDASAQYVPLQNEVDCIRDFIELQKLRLTDKVSVEFSIEGNLEGIDIAPLLLMTYVENIFKHGISAHEPADIDISIKVLDRAIHFYCRNSVFKNHRNAERSGIGLKNNQMRLAHLYPGKHTLTINADDDFYRVDLSITVN